MASAPALVVKNLGRVDYQAVWQAMSVFTDTRTADEPDQLWLVEHPPVFTQGQAGKAEHLLSTSDIPLIQSDRGGQITYHGPGQLVAYPLLNMRRLRIGVRDLVSVLEQTLVAVLAQLGVSAYAKPDAPGVYIAQAGAEAKIASLGLRVRRGCSFHGLALNVDMDLAPFSHINPCGYAGLAMTDIRRQLKRPVSMDDIRALLTQTLVKKLGYSPAAVQKMDGKSCIMPTV